MSPTIFSWVACLLSDSLQKEKSELKGLHLDLQGFLNVLRNFPRVLQKELAKQTAWAPSISVSSHFVSLSLCVASCNSFHSRVKQNSSFCRPLNLETVEVEKCWTTRLCFSSLVLLLISVLYLSDYNPDVLVTFQATSAACDQTETVMFCIFAADEKNVVHLFG